MRKPDLFDGMLLRIVPMKAVLDHAREWCARKEDYILARQLRVYKKEQKEKGDER